PALAAGAKGIAVVSAICGQPDPEAAARRIAAEIERART
ncbi:thiamine phosphate synthase, partial [Neorhizobium sp. SHOUNA12B]|nr:thiamine phosphate synthase [Neorhizobium sp. SHOUNA12B]